MREGTVIKYLPTNQLCPVTKDGNRSVQGWVSVVS